MKIKKTNIITSGRQQHQHRHLSMVLDEEVEKKEENLHRLYNSAMFKHGLGTNGKSVHNA